MTPSKSMPKKSNHDLMKKDHNVRVGTLVFMSIKDILTKTRVNCRGAAF